MKIKQINDNSITYHPIIEPLARTDVIEEIVKHFNFMDNQYAHVIYLHGTGGIGKTYICRALDKYVAETYRSDDKDSKRLKVYSIYYDLFKNSEYPVKLMELATSIKEVLKEPDLFEVFEEVFQIYVKRYQEQWNKQSSLLESDTLGTAINISSCVPGFSGIADAVQAGRSIVQYATSRKKNKEHQDMFNKLEHIPLDDLRTLKWTTLSRQFF